LINQIAFLTAFERFEAMHNLKMLWLPGLHPGPHWGSLQRSSRPFRAYNQIKMLLQHYHTFLVI